ncbi:hypothetical protein EK21DRAFT_95152 [Setomelanomma holmii]|uniref:Uncharacterized protein n=1 Tax=Setomelanomma holmii TaxID=210430 RepID=A0A9P4LEE0_9PLEO|nr:hypothetical protein EK21DRAFT_95152 [Setomelanomma holmii]
MDFLTFVCFLVLSILFLAHHYPALATLLSNRSTPRPPPDHDRAACEDTVPTSPSMKVNDDVWELIGGNDQPIITQRNDRPIPLTVNLAARFLFESPKNEMVQQVLEEAQKMAREILASNYCPSEAYAAPEFIREMQLAGNIGQLVTWHGKRGRLLYYVSFEDGLKTEYALFLHLEMPLHGLHIIRAVLPAREWFQNQCGLEFENDGLSDHKV